MTRLNVAIIFQLHFETLKRGPSDIFLVNYNLFPPLFSFYFIYFTLLFPIAICPPVLSSTSPHRPLQSPHCELPPLNTDHWVWIHLTSSLFLHLEFVCVSVQLSLLV